MKDKIERFSLIRFSLVMFTVVTVIAVLLTAVPVRGADPTWTQTTEAEFAAGTPVGVDTSTSSGDVLLSLVANLTLITQDNAEVSHTGDTTNTLKKTLNFTKSGATYNELRIDNNLACSDAVKIAYSDINVDDVLKFEHDTDVTGTTYPSYDSYQDILDFSGYGDGPHTYKLWLQLEHASRIAYNSTFALYRTYTYDTSTPGTLTSSAHDASDNAIINANWGQISWTATGSTVQFQIATNKDNSTWDFLGPDSTSGTYYTTSTGENIWVGHDGDRYIKYKAYLSTADDALTPTLSDVSITYDTITWASFSDADRLIPCDEYDDPGENTVYMEGTGFTNLTSYKVVYWFYDEQWWKRYTDGGVVAAADSTLQNFYSFVPATDDAGDWQTTVYYPDSYTPTDYSATDEYLVANDISYTSQYSFHAYAAAIPEFSTVMAAIGVAGLCFGIYWWMRKRYRRQAATVRIFRE